MIFFDGQPTELTMTKNLRAILRFINAAGRVHTDTLRHSTSSLVHFNLLHLCVKHYRREWRSYYRENYEQTFHNNFGSQNGPLEGSWRYVIAFALGGFVIAIGYNFLYWYTIEI